MKDEKEIAKYIDSVSFLAGLFDIKIDDFVRTFRNHK